MAQVERIREVMEAIKKQSPRLLGSSDKPSVIVGYTASYALYVHENLEMKWKGMPRHNGKGNYWDPQGRGQSKFLEQPARELGRTFAATLKRLMNGGKTLAQALKIIGLNLQRSSQLLCPVDTGNLKASAFTREE